MCKFYFLFFILFQLTTVQASEPAVGPVTVTGVSNSLSDTSGNSSVVEIYGGVAGNPTCLTDNGANTSTCDSCALVNNTLSACNQRSIYPALKVTISFTTSVAIGAAGATGNAKAELYMVAGSTAGTLTGVPIVANQTLTLPVAAGTQVSFTTTWGAICGAAGLPATCTAPTLTDNGVATATLAFGIDTSGNSSGSVEIDETRKILAKIQIIPPASTALKQNYCGGSGSGIGICGVNLRAGDNKAVLKNFTAQIGPDPSGYPWDGVVFFPVPISPPGPPAETAAYNNFKTNLFTPHVLSIVVAGTDATVADPNITGLQNYQEYCFIYASKNVTQNIYRFVIESPIQTSPPPGACVTPSEVVGLLHDKHCFISTAAFGSDMAPEVQTFREFRNKFLLTNSFGKTFVHFYNKLSPPIANVIAESDILRAITRTFLYPLLFFVHLSLNYGLIVALFVLAVFLIIAFKVRQMVRYKKTFLIVLILLLAPFLKAEPLEQTKTVIHPDGAAEGLVRIDKEGNYIYDLKRPLKHESGNIRVGQSKPPDISIDITPAGGGAVQTYHFKDFYDSSSNLLFGYDYEWFPYITHGKLGLQGGVSFSSTKGHGRLVSNPTISSEEEFSFYMVPVTLGAVYRLQYTDRQVLAPYVSGGGSFLLLAEKREDKGQPDYAGGFGFYASGGMLLNLSYFNEDLGYSLESEYGISNLWLSLEIKVVEVQASAFSFSSQYLNAGLSFDF